MYRYKQKNTEKNLLLFFSVFIFCVWHLPHPINSVILLFSNYILIEWWQRATDLFLYPYCFYVRLAVFSFFQVSSWNTTTAPTKARPITSVTMPG